MTQNLNLLKCIILYYPPIYYINVNADFMLYFVINMQNCYTVEAI